MSAADSIYQEDEELGGFKLPTIVLDETELKYKLRAATQKIRANKWKIIAISLGVIALIAFITLVIVGLQPKTIVITPS